ncbi:unnamed protein product [Sympodiomycopsis kandeliae]
MTDKPELLIQVYTDSICPWCYVGSARLEQVLESDEFKKQVGQYMQPRIEILPYILDPRLTSTSREPPSDLYTTDEKNMIFTKGSPPSKDLYYGKKFAMEGQLDSFSRKINEAGKEVGLEDFKFSGEGKVGSTWDAHRLISHAGDLQYPLSKRLYHDFHIKSLDISNHSVLAKAAVDVGIFKTDQEAKEFLNSDEQDDTVRFKLQQSEMNGVQSVPFYIVNDGMDHLSSTGSNEEFMRMFDMAAALHR